MLARAEAIQGSSERVSASDADVEAFIQAAEEVGYARTAVELALRERLPFSMNAPAAGELAFAKSADGKYYIAQVLSSGREGVRVRFMRGGEHTVAVDDLRPCSFLPGERVVCPWPSWGPWTCTVLSYDAPAQRIKVSDGWGDTREFPISEVWLNPPPKSGAGSRVGARISVALIVAGAGVGALLGSIITALLMR